MTSAARAFGPTVVVDGSVGDHDRLRVDQALGEALGELRRVFGGNPRLEPIFERVGDFVLQGGKRLRPRLCVASHRILCGSEPAPPVWAAAASLEIFHAFMLIHDDIVDESATRRDRPTLHERFRLDAELAGEADGRKLGADLALLAGDLLFAAALRLVARSGLSDAALGRSSRLIADMLIETGLGETLDVLYDGDPLDRLGEAPLIETYLRKTARYTVSGPLVLGATIAGAGPKVRRALDRFGDLLGFGFQIRNDMEGLAADVERGDHSDLDSGKRTYVLWTAHRRLDATGRRALDEALAAPPSVERRRRLLALIEESGALRECRVRVARLWREAVDALRDSPLSASQRLSYVRLAEEFRLKSPSRPRSPKPVFPPAHPSPVGSERACNP